MRTLSVALALLAALLPFVAFGETQPVDPEHIKRFYGVKQGQHRESLDCTAEEQGRPNEICRDLTDDTLWWCDEASTPCTGADWVQVGGSGSSGAPTDAEYVVTEANATLSAEVAPSGASQVPLSTSSTAAAWTTVNAGTDLTADLEEDAHCSEHNSGDIDCSGETIVYADDSVDDTNLNITKAVYASWSFPRTEDDIKFKVYGDSTITPVSLDCIASGTIEPGSLVIRIDECGTGGGSCSTTGGEVDIAFVDTNNQDTTFADTSLANDNWAQFNVFSFTNSPEFAHCRFLYTY